MSGVCLYVDWVTSEKIDPANLFSSSSFTNRRHVFSLRFNSGVTESVTSSTGAIAVTIPERGLDTSKSVLLK